MKLAILIYYSILKKNTKNNKNIVSDPLDFVDCIDCTIEYGFTVLYYNDLNLINFFVMVNKCLEMMFNNFFCNGK